MADKSCTPEHFINKTLSRPRFVIKTTTKRMNAVLPQPSILTPLFALLLSGLALHAKEKTELLSAHSTIAVYEGIEFRTCRGRTALCPKKCGNSGEFANFRIVEYLKYEKTGKYGDKKQKAKVMQVSDFFKNPKGEPKYHAVIKTLKKGDRVRLDWDHNYVTSKGSSYPARPITRLEKAKAD